MSNQTSDFQISTITQTNVVLNQGSNNGSLINTQPQVDNSLSVGSIDGEISYINPSSYISYANFPLCFLDINSDMHFTILYISMVTLFAIFLVTYVALSKRLFHESRTSSLSQSSKAILRVQSLVLGSFIFVLQIPFLTILFQGYMCGEDPEDIYILNTECGSAQNLALSVVSTFILLIYLPFIAFQRLIYNSRNLEAEFPWDSLSKKFDLLSVLIKILVPAFFVFDKGSNFLDYTKLVVAGLLIYSVYHRITQAKIISESVFVATIIYEVVLAFVMIFAAIKQLDEETFTIFGFIAMIVTCFMLSGFALLLRIALNQRSIFRSTSKYFFKANHDSLPQPIKPKDYELYFFMLFQYISSDDPQDTIVLQCLLSEHMERCQMDEKCQCQEASAYLDGLIAIKEHREALREQALREYTYFRSLDHPTTKLSGENETFDNNPIIKGSLKEILKPKNRDSIRFEKIDDPNHEIFNFTSNQSISIIEGSSLNRATLKTNNSNYPKIGESSGHKLSTCSGDNSRDQSLQTYERFIKIANTSKGQQLNKSNFSRKKQQDTRSIMQLNATRVIEEELKGDGSPISSLKKKRGQRATLADFDPTTGSNKGSMPEQTLDKFMSEEEECARRDSELVRFTLDEEVEDAMTQLKPRQAKEYWFKFLTFLMQDAINHYPKDPDLKIACAFVQKSKLQNEFKAIFELMSAEVCSPSLQNQFNIFRKKILIEQELVKTNMKFYQPNSGKIDITSFFTFEKLYQRYQLLEYITSNQTLLFWQELMSSNVNTSSILERGIEISKNYELIQDVAKRLMKKFSPDLKMLYRYGHFLKEIINNDYEAQAVFEQAFLLYQTKISKHSAGTSNQPLNNEQALFGENSACAMVFISSTSQEIGTIIHANYELKSILGFQPEEVVGQNISVIMPRLLGDVHHRFIERYFAQKKTRILNLINQQLGLTKDNYLKPINVLIKVYPQITDKIIFTGFIQNLDDFEDMQPPKMEFEGKEYHYLLADRFGNLTNISEGLRLELGLSSQFFTNSHQFHSNFELKLICPDIMDPLIQDQLENEGAILTFDTREMLEFVELEKLTSEEVLEVRANLCTENVYVQVKRMHVGFDVNGENPAVFINIFRVIIVNYDDDNTLGNANTLNVGAQRDTPLSHQEAISSSNANIMNGILGKQTFNASSQASTSTSDMNSIGIGKGKSMNTSFNKILRDFKKALGQRRTPSILLMINKIIVAAIFFSLILAISDYILKSHVLQERAHNFDQLFSSSSRSLFLALTSSNLRSYLNIANNLEVDFYEGENLKKIERFYYLGNQVELLAIDLQVYHQSITQVRFDPVNNEQDTQSIYEFDKIDLYQLDQTNKIFKVQMPYRIGMNSYLNKVQLLNNTKNVKDLELTGMQLIKGNPKLNITAYPPTTLAQKDIMFLLLNGMRAIRERTLDAENFQRESDETGQMNVAFLVIMIFGVGIALTSAAFVLSQIFATEKNKGHILSLFSLLSPEHIESVHQQVDLFLINILHYDGLLHTQDQFSSSINTTYKQNSTTSNMRESLRHQPSKEQTRTEGPNNYSPFYTFGMDGGGSLATQEKDKDINVCYAYLDTANNEQQSEEEKDEQHLKDFKHKKKHLLKEARARGKTAIRSQQIRNQEIFREIVKNIKEIQDSENRQQSQQKYQSRDQNSIQFPVNRIQHEHHQHKIKGESQKNLALVRRESQRAHRKKEQAQKEEEDSSENTSFNENDLSVHALNDATMSGMSLPSQGPHEPENEEQQQPKRNSVQYKQGNKQINWRFITANGFVGLAIIAYFLYAYLISLQQGKSLVVLKDFTPLFFNRYQAMIYSYSFMRERMINNNSLSSFENKQSPSSPADIDWHFNQQSLDNEMKLASLKVNAPNVLSPLVEFLFKQDSEGFCSSIINQIEKKIEQQVIVTRNLQKKLEDIRKRAYQKQIQTVIAACDAASEGKLDVLMKLKAQNVDFNQGDYDKRTPLHVSAGAGQYIIVKYLIDQGVNVNPIDRWGATPLNDAQPYPEIKNLLLERKAFIGKLQPPYVGLEVTVNDDQFRLFYAAFYGDLAMMENLRLLGWNVNGQDYDGRTALNIAASEGHLDVVKYLVSKGADLSIKDARGNDPLSDAIRENRTSTIEYISSIISDSLIRSSCSSYHDGFLIKGIQQVFGTFNKKHADLQILVNTTSYNQLLNMLNTSSGRVATDNNTISSTASVMNLFFSTQELYLHKVIDKLVIAVNDTQNQFIESQAQLILWLFISFVIFLSLILYLRGKLITIMKNDVFQSRGILNLIPEELLENNREAVERIINKLKK